MLNAVTITDITAAEAIAFKFDLDSAGLRLNHDYIWRYRPVKYNNDWSAEPIEQSQAVFEFTDPALASFYKLKWIR